MIDVRWLTSGRTPELQLRPAPADSARFGCDRQVRWTARCQILWDFRPWRATST